MAHYSAADVGLGVEFHAPLHEAVEVLQTLPSRTTPLDKLLTLKGRDDSFLFTHYYATCPWAGTSVLDQGSDLCIGVKRCWSAAAPSCLKLICSCPSVLCHHLVTSILFSNPVRASAVAQCVFRCVQCHLRGVVSGAEEVGDVQLATDDLVTLLALTLIRYVDYIICRERGGDWRRRAFEK